MVLVRTLPAPPIYYNMESTNEDNQVIINDYTDDLSAESRPADGSVTGSFSFPFHSVDGLGSSSGDGPHFDGLATLSGAARSWIDYLIQRSMGKGSSRLSTNFDFFATETRPLDLRNPFKGLEVEKIGHVLVNLAIQIYGFVKCKDRGFCQIVASVNGILMALRLDTRVYDWVATEIWSLVTGDAVSPQSLEELGEALGKDAVKFVSTNLNSIVERVVKFCSAAFIAPSLLRSKAHYLRNIGSVLEKTRLSSFTSATLTVDGIVSMLAHCMTRAVEYLVNWSFPDEVTTLLRESSALRETVEATLLVMDRATRDEMLISLSNVQAKLTDKHLSVRVDKFTVAQALLKELDTVSRLITRVRNHAVHVLRVEAPLAFMVVGPPASGKSEFTKMLLYIVASIKRPGPGSMPYKSHEIVTAPSSKYWNNVTNDVRAIIFDDVGALTKPGETSQCVAARWGEGIIQLVNNQPFTPELAQAELKGTVQPRLDVVISTANEENRYGDAPSMNAPDAVFRRYDEINVRLKDEFKGPNGQIDFRLVAQGGGDVYSVSPWFIEVKRFNLSKATELARNSATKMGVNPGLWEHIEFIYQGEKRLSDDITLDMLRELCAQKAALHSSCGDAIKEMDARTKRRLFPDLPESEVLAQAAHARTDGEWYLFQCHHVAMNCSFWVQTLMLFVIPVTSLVWVIYKAVTWKSPGWLRVVNSKRTFKDHLRHCFTSCVMQYQLLLLCWGFTAARSASPLTSCVARMFGLDLRAIFLSVLLGKRLGGLFGSLPSARLTVLSADLRRRYMKIVDSLADEERRSRLQRVLVRGVFAGFTLNALLRCAKFYLECRHAAKMAAAFDKRVGPNPSSKPQTTVDGDGNIKVERDPKIDAAPRQVTFLGTYHTMVKDRLRKANPTQTVDDSRQFVGRCIHRITVVPCTGSQLGSAVRSKYRNIMHACAYDTYTSGTYVITPGHAFARDYTHFIVRIHDPSRRTKEHILCKDDIMFAPKVSMGGCEHDLDLCMFEIPRSVTGSLPVIKAMVSDSKPRVGETLTRLVPGHDDDNNVNSIDFESGDLQGVKSHVYATGTPASEMFRSPLSLWITGVGDDGMCGALVMSGGEVVAMHTGGHPSSDTITACPLDNTVLSTMKSRLVSRALGGVASSRLEDYVIREPYLEEYTTSKMEINPNVSVRAPGALEPALGDCFFDFLGTLQRDGDLVNVKAKTNITITKHVELLMDYLPNVPRLLSDYSVPALNYKMRDTVEAFVTKASIPRPGDTHLLALAKHKVGMALYSACHDVIRKEPGFAAMKVFGIQGGLDGKGYNMAGKIPLNTSAGVAFPGTKSDYAANLYSPEHNEHFVCFFEDNEMSMEILESVDDIIRRRAKGEVGLVANFMCPKDETLPVKENGKTKPPRHINKTDFAHTVAMRMYFQPVLILLGYDPLSCGHSVGLDPTAYYLELIKSLVNGDTGVPLYEHDLQESNFIATDYSGFDLSLSGDVLAAVMDILINLTYLLDYKDEDRRVMASMAYDICNPSVVMLSTIVQLAGVNTSGNPLTTMINCVANMMINCQIATMVKHDVLRGKYMEDYPREYSRLTLDDVDFDIRRIVTYGDDVVIRVEKDSKLTQHAVIYYGAQLGYTITGADKSSVVTKYAHGFAFLKRRIHCYVESESREVVMCLAPLAVDSIYKPFVWSEWNKVDINDHYAGLIKSAVHELVQHGEKVYNAHVPKLWNLVEAFSVETQPRKNSPLIFRSRLRSRFKGPFLSWEDSIRERYGPSLIRTKGELSPSELELIEL
jgi:hypothetical protein